MKNKILAHFRRGALSIDIGNLNYHHEKWDGSGFPRGLEGEQIHLATRIFAVVYGLVHAMTGKATYSNLNIYTEDLVQDQLPIEQPILLGFLSVNSEKSVESKQGMKGSALTYLPSHPEADILYAWKLTRNCQGEEYCLEIPESPCERLTFEKLYAAFRLYVEPKTLVGPTASEILYDRVILFTSP